jgi:transposase
VRDLLRKRGQLVEQRTRNILSIENLTSRNRGERINGNRVKQLSVEAVESQYENEDLALAVTSTLSIMEALSQQIAKIERRVKEKIRLAPSFEALKTVSGIGDTLALTIMLETGNVNRFPSVGDFSSYCRCVRSQKLSNGKKKGSGNNKNGNAYLIWAFMEAAHFAIVSGCDTPSRKNGRAEDSSDATTPRPTELLSPRHGSRQDCVFGIEDNLQLREPIANRPNPTAGNLHLCQKSCPNSLGEVFLS